VAPGRRSAREARDPEVDRLALRPRLAYELPRAREVGTAPGAARARLERVGAVRFEASEVGRQRLAGRPREALPDAEVAEALAVEGERDRLPRLQGVERRDARVEDEEQRGLVRRGPELGGMLR